MLPYSHKKNGENLLNAAFIAQKNDTGGGHIMPSLTLNGVKHQKQRY